MDKDSQVYQLAKQEILNFLKENSVGAYKMTLASIKQKFSKHNSIFIEIINELIEEGKIGLDNTTVHTTVYYKVRRTQNAYRSFR